MKLLTGFKRIKNLPAFCEVKLRHRTGDYFEQIIIWSPLAWNERFTGTAGGGISTGGHQYITPPNNTTRGLTLPFALVNGFTAATADAGNIIGRRDLVLDQKTHELQDELIENWRARTTHNMTRFSKAVAEILHQRPVQFSYLHGGSGGGRQSMVEAQEYPQDYDGIWASCPAINWSKFVLAGLWPNAVMNSYGHTLTPAKLQYFLKAVHDSTGGRDAYYKKVSRVNFDPFSVIGQRTKNGPITTQDALIMNEIWNGPRRKNGQPLWVGFRPGVKFWNVGLPVGLHYSIIRNHPKPFFIVNDYARWVTQDLDQDFSKITMDSFEELFDKSVDSFKEAAADKTNLQSFVQSGGKLIIDHGLDDPLIPVDGTIDYFDRLCQTHASKDAVDDFCRLYLTPGDGHGNCYGNGPGITESDGMHALIEWVEKGRAPGPLRVVQVKRLSGKLVSTGFQRPV